jgi:hypothetical protein
VRWLAAHPQHRQAGALRERLLEHYPEVPGIEWVMPEWLPNHANAEAAPDNPFRLPSLVRSAVNPAQDLSPARRELAG